MRLTRIALATAIAVVGLLPASFSAQASTSWPSFGGSAAGTFSAAGFPGLYLDKDWTAPTVFQKDMATCVIASGGRVFTAGRTAASYPNFRVFAYDASTGVLLWQSSDLDGSPTNFLTCPVTDGTLVYFALAQHVTAYDVSSGSVQWRRTGLPIQLATTPVLLGNALFVASEATGNALALNKTSGTTIWTAADCLCNAYRPPRAVGTTFVVGTNNASTQFAANANTGATLWHGGDQSEYGDMPYNVTALSSTSAYITNFGGTPSRVLSVGLTSGSINWTYPLGGGLQPKALALTGNDLYVAAYCFSCGTTSSKVIKLNATDGSLVWSKDAEYGSYDISTNSYKPSIIVLGNRIRAGNTFYDTTTGETLGGGSGWPDNLTEVYPAFGSDEVFAFEAHGDSMSLVRLVPGSPPSQNEGTGGGGSGGSGSGGGAISCRTPPTGPVGVTIDDGAIYTNSPRVDVGVIWPTCTDTIRLSNDGGFKASRQFDVSPTVSWTLASSGPERLPKTVYMRFGAANTTYTDDIILDETDPILASIDVSTTESRVGHPNARAKTGISVTTVASDKTSGVGKIQITSNKKKPGRLIKYAKTVKASVSGSTVWVRVQDKAGNFSAWKKATV